MTDLSRRRLLTGSAGLVGAGFLGGCEAPALSRLATPYDWSNGLTFAVQRWLLRRQPLVREFGPEAISAVFPTINTTDPDDPGYKTSKAIGFTDWKLPVTGLVERPGAFSLADLKSMRPERRSRCTAASRDGPPLPGGRECRSQACSLMSA